MPFRFRLHLITAAFLAAGVLAGCEDDPILGPTDKEPSNGGSYGVIHFDHGAKDDSTGGVQLNDFLKENPERF